MYAKGVYLISEDTMNFHNISEKLKVNNFDGQKSVKIVF